MLHFYYDRHEQVLTRCYTKTCTVDRRRHNGHRRYLTHYTYIHHETLRLHCRIVRKTHRQCCRSVRTLRQYSSAAEMSCRRSVLLPKCPYTTHTRMTVSRTSYHKHQFFGWEGQGWFWTIPSVVIPSSECRELHDCSSRSISYNNIVFFSDFSVITASYFFTNGISITLKYNFVCG